jgi:SSS family solute:Na+ symporter
LISLAVIIGAPCTAAAPNEEKLEFTYGQVTPEQRAENREVGRAAMWASVGVVALILVIYLYFSFWL